jgi:hypothetical protein
MFAMNCCGFASLSHEVFHLPHVHDFKHSELSQDARMHLKVMSCIVASGRHTNTCSACRLPSQFLKSLGGANFPRTLQRAVFLYTWCSASAVKFLREGIVVASDWISAMVASLWLLQLDMLCARLFYVLAVIVLPLGTWMYLACRSASPCQSRCKLNAAKSMLPSQEAHSSRATNMWQTQVAPKQLLEEQRRGTEAIKILLLMCLGCGAALWLYLLPQKASALAIHAVLITFGVFCLLHIHCDILRVSQHFKRQETVRATDSSFYVSVVPFIVVSWMLAHGAFFGSGHFSEFAGIQWPSAFVGFQDSTPMWRSAMLVACNTFAPQALVAVVVGVLVLFTQSAVLLAPRCSRQLHNHESSQLSSGKINTSQFPSRISISSVQLQWWQLRCKLRVKLQPVGLSGVTKVMQREASNQVCKGIVCEDKQVSFRGCVKSWLFVRVLNQMLFIHARNGIVTEANIPRMVGKWTQHGACMHAVDVMKALSAAFCAFIMSVILFATSASVFIHRGHLMIWALFAPKWLFEVCMSFVGGFAGMYVNWQLQCRS